MMRARLAIAFVLLVLADLLIGTGCATRVNLRETEVVVVWGASGYTDCGEHNQAGQCISGTEMHGGSVSDSFARWLGKLVTAAASMLPGASPPPDPPVVNVHQPVCK